MKKVLAILLTVAMLISMASIMSFAESKANHLQVDSISGIDANGNSTGLGTTDSELGNVAAYESIKFSGWIYPEKEIETVGYALDGADPVYDGGSVSVDTATGAIVEGWGEGWEGATNLLKRYTLTVPVVSGTHSFDFILKFTDDSTANLGTYNYVDLVEEWCLINDGSNGSGVGAWVKKVGEKNTAVFTATGSFSAISLHQFWASKAGDNKAVSVTMSLYKYRYNYENSLKYSPIASTTVALSGDKNAFHEDLELTFANPLNAGSYIVSFELASAQDGGYFVLPTSGNADKAIYNTEDGNTFNFQIKSYGGQDAYGELPTEEEAPAWTDVHGMSYDSFYKDSELNFGAGDGAASLKLDANGRTFNDPNSSISYFRIRGWVGFEGEIEAFGYSIGNEVPVFDKSFTQDTEDAVRAAGNGGDFGLRFDIKVPVSGLKGTNKIVACAKLTNGEIVYLDEKAAKDGNTVIWYVGPDGTATFHGASFDTIWTNDDSGADQINFGQGDGGAASKIPAVVDGSDGSIEKITLRGWIGFEETLQSIGYQIGDNEPVFDKSQLIAAEEAVLKEENGGANAWRFQVEIPVADLEGSNDIVLVAKVDGNIVKLDSSLPVVGAATAPDTAFTYVGPAPVTPPTADASLVIFVLAACAIALVVLKKKAF